jgi:membrane-bound lytic murein transglycosylase D
MKGFLLTFSVFARTINEMQRFAEALQARVGIAGLVALTLTISLMLGCTTTGVTVVDGSGGAVAPVPPKVDIQVPQRDPDRSQPPPAFSALLEPEDFGESAYGEEEDITLLLEPDLIKKFDIPIVFNDAVDYNIRWFTTEKRKVFTTWLRRSRLYAPIIRKILREQGLPEDLVYLAMIESGFNPKANSPMKACGPWQFIYATGGRYGLKVSQWVDERRDPEKSTVAAAKYLRDLFNQFGCWYLAAAGYNAGERRVERAIERHNTNDFWQLARYNALPGETREYIPRLIAAAIIAKEPEKYGFDSITYEEPLRTVTRVVPSGTPLMSIAKAASLEIDTVRTLNPEILRGITPPDESGYRVKLPADIPMHFATNLDVVLGQERKVTRVTMYKLKLGDTTAKAMKRHGLSYADFCLVNDCGNDGKIGKGTIINIPVFAKGSVKGVKVAKAVREDGERPKREVVGGGREEKPKVTAVGPEAVPGYHVVRKGETLAGIAGMYGVDVDGIKVINNLKTETIQPNMKLKLASHSEKTKKTSVKVHAVKKGETLAKIADKYGVEPEALKAHNGLKSDRVRPKMKLKIPAKPSVQG